MSTLFRTQLPPSTDSLLQQRGGGYDPMLIAKLSADMVRQEQAIERARFEKVSAIRGSEKAVVHHLLTIVKESAISDFILANRQHMSPDFLRSLNPEHMKKVSEAAPDAENALMEGAADGALAEAELEDMLVEAAMSDPAAAAQLITQETGETVSPEEVSGAVEGAADAAMSTGDEGLKTSSAVNAIANFHKHGFVKSASALESLLGIALQHRQQGRR